MTDDHKIKFNFLKLSPSIPLSFSFIVKLIGFSGNTLYHIFNTTALYKLYNFMVLNCIELAPNRNILQNNTATCSSERSERFPYVCHQPCKQILLVSNIEHTRNEACIYRHICLCKLHVLKKFFSRSVIFKMTEEIKKRNCLIKDTK